MTRQRDELFEALIASGGEQLSINVTSPSIRVTNGNQR